MNADTGDGVGLRGCWVIGVEHNAEPSSRFVVLP